MNVIPKTPLPEGFSWLIEDDLWTLLFRGQEVIRISKVGEGWVGALLAGEPDARHQVAFRSPSQGAGWATQWVRQRRLLFEKYGVPQSTSDDAIFRPLECC